MLTLMAHGGKQHRLLYAHRYLSHSPRPPARNEPPARLTHRRLFAMTAQQEGHQVLRALSSSAREALLL